MQSESSNVQCPCSAQCKCTCCRYLGNIGHDPDRTENENEMDDRTESINEVSDRIDRRA